MSDDTELQRIRDSREGRSRTGYVDVRDFDCGVVETLGAKIDEDLQGYFLEVEGITPPPGPDGVTPLPGVPVVFENSEDIWEKYKLPVIVVRQDDISPAMNRWHPGTLQYRTASATSNPVHLQIGQREIIGVDEVEQVEQAVPFDIMYTVSVQARHRGPGRGVTGQGSPRNQANAIFKVLLRVYPPYCRVLVRDSIGDIRDYGAFMEGVSKLDEVSDVAQRMIGFGLTLRVEAELDLIDPVIRKTVTQRVFRIGRF
jgi:hypothetical protein